MEENTKNDTLESISLRGNWAHLSSELVDRLHHRLGSLPNDSEFQARNQNSYDELVERLEAIAVACLRCQTFSEIDLLLSNEINFSKQKENFDLVQVLQDTLMNEHRNDYERRMKINDLARNLSVNVILMQEICKERTNCQECLTDFSDISFEINKIADLPRYSTVNNWQPETVLMKLVSLFYRANKLFGIQNFQESWEKYHFNQAYAQLLSMIHRCHNEFRCHFELSSPFETLDCSPLFQKPRNVQI